MGTNGPFPRSHLITVFRVMEAGSVRWCSRVHRLQSDKAGLTAGPPSPGLPRWLSGKESACNAEDPGLIPGSGRSPGEGNGYPFQYSCLGNPMDRGAWQATVHRVANSQTQLKRLRTDTCTQNLLELSYI